MSFRGAAAALALVAAGNPGSTPDGTPSPTAIRSWILRLGYAQLIRSLDASTPWVWLIDHTIQIGSTKLFVILGVRLDRVPFGVRALRSSDLQLVALVPMEQSNRHRVDEELQAAVARTGVPRQIVADGNRDLQDGITLFRGRNPRTRSVPDVAHAAANLLKHYWEKDDRWAAFTRRMSETAAKLRQTHSAHLLAPRLRNKERFMSVGATVRFARIVLAKLSAPTACADAVRHYGWVAEFADAVAAWSEQHALVQAVLRQVRVEGHWARGVAEVESAWSALALSDNPVTAALRTRLRVLVVQGSRGLEAGERLVGSTEVLESVLGIGKRLSGDQAGSGFTGLSVGLGAMLGERTAAELAADLDRVPAKAPENWAKRTLGPTLQWLRKQFWNSTKSVPVSG